MLVKHGCWIFSRGPNLPVITVPKPAPDTLGSRVRARREALGLSQTDVATACQMQYQSLARIERGAVDNPTLKTLRLLAKALNCTVAELIGEKSADSGGKSAGE